MKSAPTSGQALNSNSKILVSISNKNGRLSALEISGLLIYSVTFFHLLRNLTLAYYGVWILSLLIFVGFRMQLTKKTTKENILFAIIFVLFAYCVLISFYFESSFGNPLIGIIRFGFILPVIFAMCFSVNQSSFSSFFSLWSFFVLISALSLLIQYFIGPISWFSESFERVGTTRFGSLAGSLTTFGNIVGAAVFIVLMSYRRSLLLMIALTILALGAIASLQKAGFASIGISILTLILARKLRVSTVLGLILVGGIIGVAGVYVADYQTRGTILLLFETVIGTVDASQASDVSIFQSVSDRIFELPVVAFEYYGAGAVWKGIGVFGGSGSLGYPFLPHPHNLLGETILLFGLIPGSLIIIYLGNMLFRSFIILINISGKYDQNSVIAAGLLINITLPTVFAGALFYHPAGATIFWAAVIYLQLYSRSTNSLPK